MPGSFGFRNAPVTKFILLLTAISTFINNSTNNGDVTAVDLHSLLSLHTLGALILRQFIFKSLGELFYASILMYTLRICERQLGSRKYASFLLITLAVALSLGLVGTLYMGLAPSSGPYASIFAALVLFYIGVPPVNPHLFGIAGFHFSENTVTYILALQLMLSGGSRSLFAALCGAVGGIVYRMDALPLNRIILPHSICRLFSFMRHILQTDQRRPSPSRARTMAGGIGAPLSGPGATPISRQGPEFGAMGGSGGGNGGLSPPLVATPPAPPPPEDSIQAIVNLGFSRESAISALRRSGNNVEVAANRLLSGA